MHDLGLYIVDVTYHIKTVFRSEFGYEGTDKESHPERKTEYHVAPKYRPDLVAAQVKYRATTTESYEIHSLTAHPITIFLESVR